MHHSKTILAAAAAIAGTNALGTGFMAVRLGLAGFVLAIGMAVDANGSAWR